MLEDTGADLVLSTSLSRSSLSERPGLRVIELDGDWERIGTERSDLPSAGLLPDNLAYVIYTSGSTGRPKGVMIEHRSVVSLITGIGFSIDSTDVILSTGSPTFDASTFEYWAMLLTGGKLILCLAEHLLDAQILKREIIQHNVNKMWFTSSWLNQLIDTDITIFKTLDVVLAGGEKLSEPYINQLQNEYPNLKIINGYGPTENTTFSLICLLQHKHLRDGIPIGKPLHNRTAYILTDDRRLQPVGVPGEIYLGGAGVSRGYLNRAELTSEKFIVDQYGAGGGRLYRTGDLGRWLPDGNIEFLGRIDDQVKIRGYRIELGEIESVLQQSGLVRQAVVVARDDDRGNKRLVGYIVAEGIFDRDGLMVYLQGQLPDYMIPALWLSMESIPLTSNGKVDKRKLPAVDAGELVSGRYVAPRNQTESVLAEIWQDLLGVARVGIHDNFFELGGDSIKSIQLISQIKKKFKTKISVKQLFQAKYIIALADYIEVLSIDVNSSNSELFTIIEL
jgi:amino acid adenylation domain-containing protein